MKNNKAILFTLSMVFSFLNIQADSWLGGTFRGAGRTVENAGKTGANLVTLGLIEREKEENDQQSRREERRERRRNRKEREREREERQYAEENEGNGEYDDEEYED